MYWTFDRPDRLGALAGRALLMVEQLRRETLDHPRGGETRAVLARRIDVAERRLARLRLLARVARHNARLALAVEARP